MDSVLTLPMVIGNSVSLFLMQSVTVRPIIAQFYYRAACNADAVLRGEFCLSVCPSVCLSVTRVIPDKTEERSVQIFIPYERTFILVF